MVGFYPKLMLQKHHSPARFVKLNTDRADHHRPFQMNASLFLILSTLMQPHSFAGVTQKQANKPARKAALQVNSTTSVISAPLLHPLLHTFIISHASLSDESVICNPPPPFPSSGYRDQGLPQEV